MTKEYGIRPYIEKDEEEQTYIDRMKRNTYFNQFATMVEKHSELMKPYADDEGFPEMEQYYPPTWDGNPGETKEVMDVATDGSGNAGGLCVLSCFAPYKCEDPVKCHFSMYQTPPNMSPYEALGHMQLAATETSGGGAPRPVDRDRVMLHHHNDGKKVNPAAPPPPTGTIFPMQIAAPAGGWNWWPEMPMNKLVLTGQDPAGNICVTTLDVWCKKPPCCENPDYIVAYWDEENPLQITPGNSITLWIVEGCSDFTWTVTGQGYSFAAYKTQGPSNTLSLANKSCGTAGDTAGPVGTVTIVDGCGTSITKKILSTGGTWKMKGSPGATCPDASVCIGCDLVGDPITPDFVTQEDNKYDFPASGLYYKGGGYDTCVYNDTAFYLGVTTPVVPLITGCTTPVTCASMVGLTVTDDPTKCAGDGCENCYVNTWDCTQNGKHGDPYADYNYYKWECP